PPVCSGQSRCWRAPCRRAGRREWIRSWRWRRNETRFSVLGSRFSVLGSRFLVLGSWFSVLGSRFLVLGSWFTGFEVPVRVRGSRASLSVVAPWSIVRVGALFQISDQVGVGANRSF